MSTRKETIKSVLINFRITEALSNELKKADINISETCREALLKEVVFRGLQKKIKVK
jgi:post-segregation antitoxin (ccd killing protein)